MSNQELLDREQRGLNSGQLLQLADHFNKTGNKALMIKAVRSYFSRIGLIKRGG